MKKAILVVPIVVLTILTSQFNAASSTSYSADEHQSYIESVKEIRETRIKAHKARLKAEAKKAAKVPPKVETAPVQAPVIAGGDCEAYRPLVAKYDWDVNTMMRIMSAESGCNPTNHNWKDTHKDYLGNVICYGSWGLFNIGCVHGHSRIAMENPANNIAAAYAVWNGGNYRAWSTY